MNIVTKNCYLGLISGTSLDGIDAALVSFENQIARIEAQTFSPYKPDLRAQLRKITTSGAEVSLEELLQIDHHVGLAFAAAAQPFSQQFRDKIIAIGSHGQTIFHSPQHSNSWQIGDPNLIAELTGITTVSDFRRRDMAAGGEGAPLTPAFHASQFGRHDPLAVLNLGGIANLTILAGGGTKVVTLGFDTGPANTLMDQWIQHVHQRDYDHNGEWARSGKADHTLLTQLRSDPFFFRPAPKSTGTDYFNLDWLRIQIQHCTSTPAPEDIQATLLQLTSTTIIDAINQYAGKVREVILCGGGVKNHTLRNELAQNRPDLRWTSSSAFGIDSDYLEAAAFAWMAKQSVEKTPTDLRKVTGATQPVILGSIYQAN